MSVLFVDGFEEYDMPSVPQGRYEHFPLSGIPDPQRHLLGGLCPIGTRIIGWMVQTDPNPVLVVGYVYPDGRTEQRQYILGSTHQQ